MCHKQSLSHPAYIMIFCVMLYESYTSSIERTSKATCQPVFWRCLGRLGGQLGPPGCLLKPSGSLLGPLWGLWGFLVGRGKVLGAVDGLKRRNAKKGCNTMTQKQYYWHPVGGPWWAGSTKKHNKSTKAIKTKSKHDKTKRRTKPARK